MRYTQTFSGIFRLFLFLLLIGVIFANDLLIAIMVIPLLLLLVGLALEEPGEVKVTRDREKTVLYTGDTFKNTLEIEITKGLGVMTLSDNLPSNFELVGGNNFMVIWKGFGPKTVTMEYEAKVVTSGSYNLDNFTFEGRHFLNFKHPAVGKEDVKKVVEVRPRLLEVKKDGGMLTRSKIPLPLGSLAKMGIPTLDFKELRNYTKGDSFKFINWKATARSAARGTFAPIVNEYEKEGKKSVWIFLDRSSSMEFGLNIKNAFEYAIEAVNGLAYYYLKQNCLVSLCTYNGEEVFIYPGEGQKQYHKILKELIRLNVTSSKKGKKDKKGPGKEEAGGKVNSLEKDTSGKSDKKGEGEDKIKSSREETEFLPLHKTIIKHKKYLMGSRPLCIFVTRLSVANAPQLALSIKEAAKYTGLIGGRLSVLIINIGGYDLAAKSSEEKIAARILTSRDNYLARKLKKGPLWVDWNPAAGSFTTAFLAQVVKR